MYRRQLLLSLAGGVAAACSSAQPLPTRTPGASGSEEARLDALLERIFREQMKDSPETMTSLGLDRGEGAWAKSRLDARSPQARARKIEQRRAFLAELRHVDRGRLRGVAAARYDTVFYAFDVLARAAEQFDYGAEGDAVPYAVSQLDGAYQSIPDFLEGQHAIESAEDAEAYLQRLEAFPSAIDQETELLARDGARGAIPPDFILDKTLLQMRKWRATPVEETSIVVSLVRRTREARIAGDWSSRAARSIEGNLHAALDRQMATLERWRARAVHDAGVWRLPHGDAYYAFGAKLNTTTNMSPDDIHRLGLERVAEISGQIDSLMRGQGLASGSIGERFVALGKDARFLRPNTDAGKAAILEVMREKLRAIESKLPSYFGHLPKSRLEVKRVPPAIEAGAPRGHYDSGSIDGARPGVYSINLRDTAEWPTWYLPTFAYHEGVPGHHLQRMLALEAKDAPLLCRNLSFNAFSEGWALYAEDLADEMGMYDADPFGRLGRLQSLLLRAARLVVDSGLHGKRWGREQAIHYMRETLGDPEAKVTTEVERYTVWPGQACAYEIGHVRWLALRREAREKLGAKFDIRRFHDIALASGAVPLEVLESIVRDWMISS